MKNIYLIITLFCFLSLSLNAQSHFAKTVVIGNSFAPFWDYDNNTNELDYLQYSWDKSIAVRLTKHIYIGMNHINIYGKYISPPAPTPGKLNNFLFGGFTKVRWRMGGKSKINGTAQVGYYTGNHCTCAIDDPITREGLNYFNYGTGVDFRIYKHLYFDATYRGYLILGDVPLKYGNGGIFIGLDYRFGQLER